MKKILGVVAGLLILLIAAVLIVPSFIDWNQYKTEIVSRAKESTGRDLDIRGDIEFSVLPTPGLRVNDVHVANVRGAAAPQMVSLKSLEVRVALLPLLGGNIQVHGIRLVDPVIHLQRFADGRTNMTFSPASSQSLPSDGGRSGADGSSSTGEAPAIVVENFVIENGTVTYRDDVTSQEERIEALNGRMTAASLMGPMEASGSLVARNIPLSFKVSTGTFVQRRTLPFTAEIEFVPGEVKTKFAGTLSGLTDAPRLKGTFEASGENLRQFAGAFTGAPMLPGLMARPFTLEAAVSGSQEGAEINDLNVSLADTKASGEVTASFGNMIEADLKLTVNRLDLDEFLVVPAGNGQPVEPAKLPPSSESPVSPKAGAPKHAKPAEAGIPKNLAAHLNLSVGSTTFRGGLISEAQVDVSVANGEITVNQMSAQLPGASDLAVFGFVTMPGGAPQFDGTMDVSTNDLRAVLGWLGVDAPPIARDRLRKLVFAGKVTATPAELRLNQIDLNIDTTRIKGAATVALRERLAVGANLVIDQANLDAYLPGASGANGGVGSESSRSGSSSASNAKTSGQIVGPSAVNPLAGLTALNVIDANLKATLGVLTYRGIPIRDIRFDGTAFDGKLTVRELRIADAAGVSASLSGAVTGLNEAVSAASPRLDDMTVETNSKNLAQFFKTAGIAIPFNASGLGAVSMKGTFSGTPSDLAAKSTISAAGGTYSLDGRIGTQDLLPALDTSIRIQHSSLQRLMRVTGINYNPAGNLGGIDLAARISGTPLKLSITDLSGSVADTSLAGSIEGTFDRARPRFVADLTTGVLQIDRFLPAQRRASFDPAAPRVRHALLRVPEGFDVRSLIQRVATEVHQRWSTSPIDLSVLGLADADVTLKSKALAYQKYRLDDADLTASLTNGVLTAKRLTGALYGGALEANGRLASGNGGGQYAAKLEVDGLNLPTAMKALGIAAFGSGKMTAMADLSANGRSVADLVSTLGGAGQVSLARIDPLSRGGGIFLGPLIRILAPLNSLVAGKQGASLADISTSFKIDKGVAGFDDLKISSGIATGGASGSIDLPAWRIDTSGEVKMEQTLLTALVAQGGRLPERLPFKISGNLDAPNVKLETGGLGGIAIPGLDKLRNKEGIGQIVDQILPGILGGGQTAPQSDTKSDVQSEPEKAQEQPKPKVDDFIKGILKGLGR